MPALQPRRSCGTPPSELSAAIAANTQLNGPDCIALSVPLLALKRRLIEEAVRRLSRARLTLSPQRATAALDPKLTPITAPVEMAAGRCTALKVIEPPPGAPGRTRAPSALNRWWKAGRSNSGGSMQ